MQNYNAFRNENGEKGIPVKSYQLNGHTMIYQMPKELDHHIAQDLCREIDMLVEVYQIVELVLDFSQTEFMDSSGIGVVIGRSKTMQYRRGNFYVTKLCTRVQAIFHAAGLFQIVQVKEV